MDSPLSKANIAEIKRTAAKVADCRIKIERAEAAGLDMTEQKLRCEHLSKSLQQLLDIYSQNAMKGNNG